MARKSRWQQFADNFNSVYGTFNNLAKNIESRNIMDEEYTDADGIALTGADLDRRRMEELSSVMTKYGDAAGGLQLRNQLATLEAANRENDINNRILDQLIDQRGILQSNLMRSQTNQNNASANASDANAGYTRFRTARGEQLLPGELTNQGLVNQGLQIDNDMSALNYGIAQETRGDRVREIVAGADTAVAGADTAEANAIVAEDNALFSTATNPGRIEATNTGNAVTTQQNEMTFDQLSAEEQILVETNQRDFENPEDAEAFYIETVRRDPRISAERKEQIIAAVQRTGLGILQQRGLEIAQGGRNALQTGGLPGLVDYYSGVVDGSSFETREVDGSTAFVQIDDETGNAVELYRVPGTGQEADDQISRRIQTQLMRPGTGMEYAAAEAALAQSRARTELIGSQKFSEILGQDLTQAKTELVGAQIAQTRAETQAAGVGLSDQREIAERGLANLMNSNEFLLMGQIDPDNPNTGRTLQFQAIDDYRRQMGMGGTAPAGVEPLIWYNMTDDERAAFR